MSVFSAESVERGRRYHRPRYVVQAASLLLSLAWLGTLAFTGVGDALLPGWPWWAQALVFPGIVLGLGELLQLPLAHWNGYVRERAWGLSTQSRGAWFVDRAKAFAVSTAIGTVLLLGLVAVARATDAWVWIAAPLAAAVVVLLTFVAPVILEPIFNRFEPLADEELAADLRAVADRAGVPVRDVLVTDASRRTTKQNAYVSGFGATRRVVIFDTLLRSAEPAELRAVLAHELAHRRYRDVLNLTLLAVAAVVGVVFVVRALVPSPAPRDVPLVLLVLVLSQLVAAPALAAVMRRWEYRADRFAVETTGEPRGLESAFARLVDANVADLDPPRIVYFWQFTHPTVPERVAAIRRLSRGGDLDHEEAA